MILEQRKNDAERWKFFFAESNESASCVLIDYICTSTKERRMELYSNALKLILLPSIYFILPLLLLISIYLPFGLPLLATFYK